MGQIAFATVGTVALVLGLSTLASAGAASAPRSESASFFSQRGATVGMAQLVAYFEELPAAQEGESRPDYAARLERAMIAFKDKVAARYSEGTLQRLCDCPDARGRRAAALALGLLGSMQANATLAALLRDEDSRVRQLASDALWSIWFRADTEENNLELQRLVRLTDTRAARTGFTALIARAPSFAEAYNQRAILCFRLAEFRDSMNDCRKVLELNPSHFGAHAGLGQCCMKLRQPKAALTAFRNALEVNPHMEGVQEAIRALEELLGEGGKK